ncbi:MAG: hypothetical protein NXH75_03260 [Halobacteriovoraceae bacterium]|nr:hypothetical protein [Halobacteriovoraceae bacterium]
MRHLTLFIILLTFSLNSWSQREADEDIKFDISLVFGFDKSFNKTTKRNLKKDFFDILIETEKFNFVIPTQKKNYENIRFYGRFKTNRKGYSTIEMDLIDPNGKVINKVSDDFVLQKKVLFRSRSLFLELFAGNYGEEVPIKKDKTDVAVLIPKVKNAFVNQAVAKGKIKPPPKPEKKIPDDPLQEDEEEKEVQAKAKPPKEKKKKKRKKPKNTSDISNFENSPVLDLTKDYPEKPRALGVPARWLSDFTIMVGQESETVLTQGIVDIQTTTRRLSVGMDANFGQEESIGFIGIQGAFGLIVGEHEYGFGPKFQLGSGYYVAPFGEYVAAGAGILLHTFNFAGLIERGAGITKSSHSGLWAGGGLKVNLDQFISGLSLSAHMYNSFVTTATIGGEKEIPTTGRLTQFSASTNMFWGLGLGFKYDSISVSSASDDDFVTSDESFSIFITL